MFSSKFCQQIHKKLHLFLTIRDIFVDYSCKIYVDPEVLISSILTMLQSFFTLFTFKNKLFMSDFYVFKTSFSDFIYFVTLFNSKIFYKFCIFHTIRCEHSYIVHIFKSFTFPSKFTVYIVGTTCKTVVIMHVIKTYSHAIDKSKA